MTTDPTPTAREALARLLPSDAIIDSCGDYEDIEVGYRCQGWEAREWRALATEATDPLAARVAALVGMLAAMEWVQPSSNASPSCPWCGNHQHFGHDVGCSLARALLPPADGSRVER